MGKFRLAAGIHAVLAMTGVLPQLGLPVQRLFKASAHLNQTQDILPQRVHCSLEIPSFRKALGADAMSSQ